MKLREYSKLLLLIHLINVPTFIFPLNTSAPAFAQTANNRELAEQLLEKGYTEFKANQFSTALKNWQQALIIYQALGDRYKQVAVLIGMGRASYLLGYYALAIDYYQKGLAIVHTLNHKQFESLLFTDLGNTYSILGKYDNAIKSHQQAVASAIAAKNPRKQAVVLLNLGNDYSQQGKYEEAISYYQQSLNISRSLDDRSIQARALNNLGDANVRQRNYLQAKDYYQQSLTLAQAIDDQKLQAFVQSNYGELAEQLLQKGYTEFKANQFSSALKNWQQTLTIYQALGNRYKQALSLYMIAGANNRLGYYALAIDYYQKGLAVIRTLNYKELESDLLADLGDTYGILGEYDNAINSYQQAKVIAIAAKNPQRQAEILLNLGNYYSQQGKYEQGVSYYQQSLNIARSLGNRSIQAMVLNNLGTSNLNVRQGNYSQAKDYLQQSLTLAQAIGDQKTQALVQSNFSKLQLFDRVYLIFIQDIRLIKPLLQKLESITALLKNLSSFDSRLLVLAKVAQSARELNNQIKELESLIERKESYQRVTLSFNQINDSLQKIISQLNEAQQIADSLSINNNAPNVERSLMEISALVNTLLYQLEPIKNNFYRQLNNSYENLLQNFGQAIVTSQQRVLSIANESRSRLEQGEALHKIANGLYLANKLPEAEEQLWEAIKIWEQLRADLSNNDSFKISFFETYISTYQLLQKVLIKQNKLEKGLEVAEMGRARAFRDLLAIKNISVSKEAIANIIKSPDIQQIKLISKQQNATLVEYSLVNKDTIFIWVIKTTGEIAFKKLDINDRYARLQQNISLKEFVTNTVIALSREDGVTPDSVERGSQNQLGFETGDRVKFKDQEDNEPSWTVAGTNPKNNNILLERTNEGSLQKYEAPVTALVKDKYTNDINSNLRKLHELLIEPIANLLPQNPNERVIFIPQAELFFVPFPALQDKDGTYLIQKHTILTAPAIQVLASTHQRRQQVPGTAKQVLVVGNPTMPKVALQPGEVPKHLAALPQAENEAIVVAKIFNTQALIGNQAPKDKVVAQMQQARLIHLATHGLLDDNRGLKSAIALTNSLLTAEEVLDLKLNAELVVLSACNTGRGRITGDGVIGLSRSIIAAGVPSIIVSLWSVEDKSTAFLMQEFYQNRQKSQDNAQALREAMLTTMKQYPSPRNWAAFTLIGEAK